MQRLSRDTVAAGGRHAEAEEVHAEEEVHHEDRQEERASEGARAHGGSLGGLSGADHQIPAGRRPRPHVIGVGSGREIAAALLEPVQPIRARSCVSLRSYIIPTKQSSAAMRGSNKRASKASGFTRLPNFKGLPKLKCLG